MKYHISEIRSNRNHFINKSGIYMITNLENEKSYIGSSKNLYRRILNHFIKCTKKLEITYAIEKYGPDNFIIEILEYTNKDLHIRESYYIDLHNTIQNGYNKVKPIKSIDILSCKICKKETTSKYCSPKCKSKAKRKVNRPTKNKLINLLKNNTFIDVGKQYGVSDNAIRKWCKDYGISPYKKDY